MTIRSFTRSPQQIVTGSRVLVCSLDSSLRESFEADCQTYLRHYRTVRAVSLSSIQDLLRTIENGYDIVHLFASVAAGGLLTDDRKMALLGTELIEKCCESDTKLLWIANDNKPEDYVKGFKATGKPLNLIMTINRNGTRFTEFLERLLNKISLGDTLPLAWAALAPQAEGHWQEELPGCIFFAGRGAVRLLS